MKKLVVILSFLLVLSGCSFPLENSSSSPKSSELTSSEGSSSEDSSSENNSSETSSEETTIKVEFLPLPKETCEFSFLSGAGAWRTVLSLNKNGEFTGVYSDSEAGSFGEDYPNGTVYVCEFSGKFVEMIKLNDYRYKLTISSLTYKDEVGKEWIEDGIKYIAAEPNGLVDSYKNIECKTFYLYTPETPLEELPEGFLVWWPYRYEQETAKRETLDCYGILNEVTQDGFFYIDEN